MPAEQIWANKLRFYKETEPRSGVVDGDVIDLPSGPAAVSREVEEWLGRLDVWRNPSPLLPAHQHYSAKLTVSVGRGFLSWFLRQHATVSGNVMNFDRRAPNPTFCMEIETEAGDRFQFRGMAVIEMQIGMTPMQIVNLDVSFDVLERRALVSLRDATREFRDPVIPSAICSASWSFGAWSGDPRTDDKLETYVAALFLTRRNLRACQFNADGVPTRFTVSPWRALAELRLPHGPLSLAAKTRALGRIGFFVGPDGADLEFMAPAAAYATADPVKAWDHREEVLSVEMTPEASGSVLFVRDNYSPSP